ncbi:MAG: hypothetical protein MUF78_11710 [Candidatus Edwardsbacteria bacterium]|nr:hypothetical protein [Candidatus Edwardsbacteria bacterium]
MIDKLRMTLGVLLSISPIALAQDPLVARVQQRLDQQRERQSKASYSYHTLTLMHTLDRQGNVEKVDTFRNWQRFVNGSLVTDSLVYSSDAKRREREGKKDGKEGKHSQSVELPKLTDPAIECTVGSGADGLAAISFQPRKPKGGDVAGELLVDPATGELRTSTFSMPRLKWPVKEFAMTLDWTEAGGLLFPSYIRMQARWNAIVSSGRIRIETTISDIRVE